MRFARFFVLLFAILLILSSVNAIRIDSIDIQIVLDKEGFAHITEKYNLGFFAGELEEFKQTASENSASLDSWQVDYPWFNPQFAELSEISETHITFDESSRALLLDYFLKNRFAELIGNQPRTAEWSIPDRKFSSFMEQSTISIPSNTQIEIKLPAGSVINRNALVQEAQVYGTNVVLSGISTSRVGLMYAVPKPIAQPLDIFSLLGQTNIMFLFSIIVVVVVIFYLKRKTVSSRIEEYIVEHSQIEPHKEGETEFEIEA